VESLVEILLLQADVLDLQAAKDSMVESTILDASMEKGRGVVSDVLISWGIYLSFYASKSLSFYVSNSLSI
jgi:translation initiation factor IF-2